MVQTCRTLLQQNPQFADAWFLLSVAAEAQRNIGKAIQLVDKALELHADSSEYLAQKAKFHALLNQTDASATAAQQALSLNPQNALTLDTLGVVLTRLGYYEQARDALKKAITLKSGNAQYHFNLASAEQFLGNLKQAELHYQQAITLQPNFARAYWALSELHKNTAGDSKLHQMQALLSNDKLSVEDALYLGHAISREHEHAGDYDLAFEQLSRAKQRKRQQLNYDSSIDAALFEAVQNAFPKPVAHKPSVATNKANGVTPLFIVGMPRSGTTLVERILSSHSEVASLGELQEFTLAVHKCSGVKSPQALNGDVIAGALQGTPEALADYYLGSLQTKMSAMAPSSIYFIDKMPLNFLYLGFILRSLPQAKIICVRRNPLDTCLSNFRQLFAVNFSYYNYHYHLEDTARYYILFHRLMEHWQQVLDDRILEVSYDELTREPETVTAQMLGYLELDWQDQCLQFHENQSAVTTASTVQVREPLYQTAVGRWQHYRKQLQPVMALLDEAGINYR